MNLYEAKKKKNYRKACGKDDVRCLVCKRSYKDYEVKEAGQGVKEKTIRYCDDGHPVGIFFTCSRSEEDLAFRNSK